MAVVSVDAPPPPQKRQGCRSDYAEDDVTVTVQKTFTSQTAVHRPLYNGHQAGRDDAPYLVRCCRLAAENSFNFVSTGAVHKVICCKKVNTVKLSLMEINLI